MINDRIESLHVLAKVEFLDRKGPCLYSLHGNSGSEIYQIKMFMHDVRNFFWDKPYFYYSCFYGITRRCVPEVEMLIVLEECFHCPLVSFLVVFGLSTKFCIVDTLGQ